MRSVKTFLVTLVAGSVVPGLFFGLGTSWWLGQQIRSNAELEGQAMAEHTALQVAEHLSLTTAALKGLAHSPSLARGNITDTYRFARSLAEDIGQPISLAKADGTHIFNTLMPLGAPLPPRQDTASLARVLATGQPSVSDFIVGRIRHRPMVSVNVPVTTAKAGLVLGTATDLDKIGLVIERQRRPGWSAVILDGKGRVLVSQQEPNLTIGALAPATFAPAPVFQQDQGAFRHREPGINQEVHFFRRIPGTTWTAVVGTTVPLLFAPLRGPYTVLAAAGGLTIGLTVLIAIALGQRLHAAANRLTEDACILGRGGELPPLTQTIAEFEQVETALHEAARLSHDREHHLAQARADAEKALAAKTRFLRAATHDLSQPMAALDWSIEVLERLPVSQQVAASIKNLRAAQAKIATLVDDLFDISKISADGLSLSLSQVSLRDLGSAVLSNCANAAASKPLSLRMRIGKDIAVTTDERMFGRILANLVHNAIRYSEKGGVLIGCRARENALWVEVWDTGVGIPANHLDLIWEEFYQVGHPGKPRGSGLGLSIVHGFAKALGYQVEVRSKPGRGSLFRVILPRTHCRSDHA